MKSFSKKVFCRRFFPPPIFSAADFFRCRFFKRLKTFADGKYIFILSSQIPNFPATFRWASRELFFKDIGSRRVQISAVTVVAQWVTVVAQWVTVVAQRVTVVAQWVTVVAQWVTVVAQWVTVVAQSGDGRSPIG